MTMKMISRNFFLFHNLFFLQIAGFTIFFLSLQISFFFLIIFTNFIILPDFFAKTAVWKNEKISLSEKIFRNINSLVKPLLSRNFCIKSDVRISVISTLWIVNLRFFSLSTDFTIFFFFPYFSFQRQCTIFSVSKYKRLCDFTECLSFSNSNYKYKVGVLVGVWEG